MSYRDTLVGDMRDDHPVAGGRRLIVLLVASTNIASLLLTRVSARQREFAVRRALGASERDIARQISRRQLDPVDAGLHCNDTDRICGHSMPFARGCPSACMGRADIALGCPRRRRVGGVFVADGGAVQRRSDVGGAKDVQSLDALRGAAAATADPSWRKFRSGLAVAEIAFALVLLAGAVTVIRTVGSLMAVDLGVRADRVLVIGVDWPNDQAQAERRVPLLQRYNEAFRALPGVESVAVTTGDPGSMPRHAYCRADHRRAGGAGKCRIHRQPCHGESGILLDHGDRPHRRPGVHGERSLLRAEGRCDQRDLRASGRLAA